MSRRSGGISHFTAGVCALTLLVAGTLLSFTGWNPFASPYQLEAVFADASNVGPRSPVRVAGIEVGRVTAVESRANGTAVVRMELSKRALPVHADAELKVRPRIFLEGNFFVSLHAGSPSAPVLADGATIPMTQTAAPVRIGDVLADLQADTRADLQLALRELAKALNEDGARGLRQTVPLMESAYRNLALSSDATLGEEPATDLRRGLRGTQRTAAGLARDERALEGAVTSLGDTVAALASRDTELAASIPALRDTLRTGLPALGSLNSTLPPLRALAREALPGVERTEPLLDAGVPAIRQARALVGPDELPGTTRALRAQLPALVGLLDVSVPLFGQGRAASRCTGEVLAPFIQSDLPDPDFPSNSGTVNQKLLRSLVGLSGESRSSDGNQSFFHTSLVPEPMQVRPLPPPEPELPPVHRPDVPCETQEAPNLEFPAGSLTPGASGGDGLVPYSPESRGSDAPAPAVQRRALGEAQRLLERHFEDTSRRQTRLLRSGRAWR